MPTDTQVLRALLGLPLGKLSPSEKRAFQGMYDDVATGRVISLSRKQRAWVDSAYVKHDLHKAQERPPVRRVEVKDKTLFKPKGKIT